MIGVRFQETMRGWIRREADEIREPFEFTVQARGRRAVGAARGVPLALVGRVSLGAPEQQWEAAGTLVIDSLRRRSIDYELQWRDGDRLLWRFSGRKALSVRRPIRSMTVLSGTLYRGGDVHGRGELRFALAELPAFVASFRPA